MKENIFNKISEFFNNSFEFGVHNDAKSEDIESKSQVWEKPGAIEFLSYLSFENCKGRNIYMRPLLEVSEYFLLVDDLREEQLQEHLQEPGRMIVESSPSNYQVWIHVTNPVSDEDKKILLQQFGSDPGAAPVKRWGRAPGFTNRKPKHLQSNGLFPYAKLHYIDFRSVDIQLPDNNVISTSGINHDKDASVFTSYGSNGISRMCYETGDPSITDFRYCMALVKRGASDAEIKALLLSERVDWQHHTGRNRIENYLKRTITKARLWAR